ncbi:hypothetical protein OG417_05115 [Actinoallomurus sp. NBC_01490]|uniref:hypothetical protein n=1 Tax=Actinoallomurus sp. NBC_01490 TaxID=2903557 RepID=UPI002E36845D|nr:hypothetical protein [Actinoallomurus sp. NBC_01490]
MSASAKDIETITLRHQDSGRLSERWKSASTIGFQHQLQRRLNDPVRDRRYPEAATQHP